MYRTKCIQILAVHRLWIILLAVYATESKAQTLQRQCVGSGGTYMFTEGTLIQQTVGQPYATNTNYTDDISYRPGFQQPVFKINPIRTTINLDVYPNPATNWVTMKSSKTLTNVTLHVVDITGKLLINEYIDKFKTYTFNCEEWKNGIYVISLADAQNNSYSSKLIILK